jgi:5-methylthioadenosine/S-adenosylhomocysteine deaminase
MDGRLVLKNCSVFRSDGRIRNRMAVLVEDGLISQVSPDEQIPVLPGDWEVPCRGRLVTPGLVDCHTHLVGGQLQPLSGEYLLRAPKARAELQQRLDSLLTTSEVEVLSIFAMARALRSGVTMLVEHLNCPADPLGALSAQARSARRLGVRLASSHSTSSLQGTSEAVRQLEGNAAYIEAFKGDPLIRPALGFHASSSCEDDLLRRVGRAREERGLGLHYHLAESEDDLISTFSRYGKRVVPRLESFGLLGPGVVAAYARAIDRSESERLMRSRTLIALGPRIGLTAEPGGGGFESVFAFQNLVGLGTSGTGLLWGELLGAFIGIVQIARLGRLLDPDGFIAQLLISAPAELCSMLYGAPSGSVEKGSLADLVVYDHVPAQEDAGGLTPNLLMQLGQARVAWTIVAGRVVVREGELLGHDFIELGREAARVLQAIWERSGAARGG